MKNIFTFIALSSIPFISAFAQDRDYGNLVTEDHFEIKQGRSLLKESADITNYNISRSDLSKNQTREEFVYKVNGVKTPKKFFLGGKSKFKLTVDRTDGKISRITSVNFEDNKNKSGDQTVKSTSVLPTGYVDTNTECYQDFKIGAFGTKKKASDFKCVTVSMDVCNYIQQNNINESLLKDLKSCSDLLGEFGKHQKNLFEKTKTGHNKDMSAMRSLNGKLSGADNLYGLESKSLKDVAEIVFGYGKAIEQCEFLKSADYFAPTTAPVAPTSTGKAKQE